MRPEEVTDHLQNICADSCVICSGKVRLGGSTYEESRDDQ